MHKPLGVLALLVALGLGLWWFLEPEQEREPAVLDPWSGLAEPESQLDEGAARPDSRLEGAAFRTEASTDSEAVSAAPPEARWSTRVRVEDGRGLPVFGATVRAWPRPGLAGLGLERSSEFTTTAPLESFARPPGPPLPGSGPLVRGP